MKMRSAPFGFFARELGTALDHRFGLSTFPERQALWPWWFWLITGQMAWRSIANAQWCHEVTP